MPRKETELSVLKEIRNMIKRTEKLNIAITDLQKEIKIIPVNPSRFTRNPDGTITDNQEKIIWTKDDLPTKMTQMQAIEACKKLGEGWRPASDKELESVIDRSRYNPAIIPQAELLGLKTDDWYITNTPYVGDPGYAWFVHFSNGFVNYFVKDFNGYVRPVRSSQ